MYVTSWKSDTTAMNMLLKNKKYKEKDVKNYKINYKNHKTIITIYWAQINSAADTEHISPCSLLVTALILKIRKFIWQKVSFS